MERQRFLANLRSRLVPGTPPNLPHPLLSLEQVPLVRYPTADFIQAASAVGTKVRTAGVREVLAEIVDEHAVRTAVLSRDPETEGVEDALRAQGVEVIEDAASADLGVTGAAWGIATTGTIVLDAGRAGGRSASLLPPVHLAILRADRILADAGRLFRAMPPLPSQLVLASGPSRSADIEQTLTVGVHGPGSVWVVIV